ncbi:MAG: 3-deoxy-manno-octulosonate cytidylyltransferase [Alphaproteobacteria bacterium]|nr:3-deoxy-manno-octulosonate cytidylyltransferase [Alphaproteobacteria bacterium]
MGKPSTTPQKSPATLQPIVVIPARMAATRLPGKPLADIAGKPMIVHVLDRANAAKLGPVVVACPDPEIAAAVEAAGGRAVMTKPNHPSGSDRVLEAVESVDPAGAHDVVVNLQGDLPTIAPAAIAAVLDPLADPAVDIATLVVRITDPAERDDPNVVKAVLEFGQERIARALYFSRSPVPAGEGPLYHHIGIYAFRRSALVRFVALPPSGLERRERLEQLRALEAGMRIDAALIDDVPLGVDTEADLAKARKKLSR